jgi:hypothetical protein
MGHPDRVRGVGEGVCWWALLVAVWWATLSAGTVQEFAVGAACAAVGAIAAVAVRRTVRPGWPPPWDALRLTARIPAAVVADTVRLFGSVLPSLVRDRSRDGGLRSASGGAGRGVAYRAAATLAVSASPGSYVVDWPPDDTAPTVHRLRGGPSRLEREALR